MRFNRRGFIITLIIIVLTTFFVGYRLPYYIYKPGGADALNPVVQVNGGFESEGDMHLVTVRGGQATPFQYVLASIMPHQEILPLDEVFPEGISQDEYFQAQLQMMESSQEASTVVAYENANKDIDIEYEGVYVVSVIENMPAYGILETGDKILSIDDLPIIQTDELINYVSSKQPGTTISVTVEREEEELTEEIALEAFPGDEKVGVGIQIVTNRNVTVDPEVEFASGNIGGPSAGLMFSLEIYDQLTEEDITRGYQIAGTGELNYQGQVGRIGGIDKKVIAADSEGCDIFFAPNENGAENSNYQVAKDTAEEIGTDMKIVPVNTFKDALTYLQNLEQR
ncbi:SepM family pheromone-processing serine protease [Aquibacillus rhizosphaerae]|uniref:endopeptidase La n=1 Tax=Aquibacillus rhizosphaerae TaxID=3051431 RepID=A0ABT7L7U6_9BACI|nr:SepM family pheromone-processing serine protease [Aquibacillus sp. LR5S19]MDL4841280.1 SepM family pheromone-processing serine protease [Aquibacillus sp. LR5S19]